MDFSFIDNSPADESERAQVVEKFVSFVDEVLSNIEAKNKEDDFGSTSEKELEIRDSNFSLRVGKCYSKTFAPSVDNYVYEMTTYEVNLMASQISKESAIMRSETYRYADDSVPDRPVERTTGSYVSAQGKTKHETEKHGVSSLEMTKMTEAVRQFLKDHK